MKKPLLLRQTHEFASILLWLISLGILISCNGNSNSTTTTPEQTGSNPTVELPACPSDDIEITIRLSSLAITCASPYSKDACLTRYDDKSQYIRHIATDDIDVPPDHEDPFFTGIWAHDGHDHATCQEPPDGSGESFLDQHEEKPLYAQTPSYIHRVSDTDLDVDETKFDSLWVLKTCADQAPDSEHTFLTISFFEANYGDVIIYYQNQYGSSYEDPNRFTNPEYVNALTASDVDLSLTEGYTFSGNIGHFVTILKASDDHVIRIVTRKQNRWKQHIKLVP